MDAIGASYLAAFVKRPDLDYSHEESFCKLMHKLGPYSFAIPFQYLDVLRVIIFFSLSLVETCIGKALPFFGALGPKHIQAHPSI